MSNIVPSGIALHSSGASAGHDNTRLGLVSCLCRGIARDRIKIQLGEANSVGGDGVSTLKMISDTGTFSSAGKCCVPRCCL